MIDLGQFIASELIARDIPPPPAGMAAADVRPPSLLMKLDVEVLAHPRA